MREFPNDGNLFRGQSSTVVPAPPPQPPPLPTISSSSGHQHRGICSDFAISSSGQTGRRLYQMNNTSHTSPDADEPPTKRHHQRRRSSGTTFSASNICQRSCSYLDHIFEQASSSEATADGGNNSMIVPPGGLQRNPRFSMDSSSTTVAASVRHKNFALGIATPIVASMAVSIVFASLAGPQWLLTEEKLHNPMFNGTANLHRPDDGYYMVKHTKSSLWILCESTDTDEFTSCTTIDYFPEDEYVPDPNDSTMAIPYAYTRSTPYFLLSGIVLLISYIVLIVAMCAPRERKILFFASGVLFIISGLIMLVGLIMYISIFKAEIGSKIRPKSPLQSPLFVFTYGESFCLYVVGFALTEMVGVLNVFLFIGLQQMQFAGARVVPWFTRLKNTKDKEMPDQYHKHSMLPNGYYSPMTQRRYLFEKLDNLEMQQSSQNSHDMDNRYNDFSASTLSPKQFPLSRSVSTATELFQIHAKNNHFEDELYRSNHQLYGTLRSQSNYHLNQVDERKTFPLDRSGSAASILSNSYRNVAGACAPVLRSKSKDEQFSDFCERAGRRYQVPKDVYFIDVDRENAQARGYDSRAADYEQLMCKSRRMSVHQMGPSSAPAATRNSNLYASNSSLHKSYPKNLFELEQQGSLSGRPKNRSTSGDSRNWRQSNEYSSQTLPRDFLKRSVELERSHQVNNRSFNNHPSRPYDRPQTFADDRSYRNKSHDSLASNPQRQSRQSHGSQDDMVNWPNAIPASPSGFSSHSQFQIRPGNLYLGHQGGHATPSRKIYGNGMYEQQQQQQQQRQVKREPPTGQQQQQTARQSPDGDFGTFDLDRIENERRKSHASLFESPIDYENGTAV